VVNFIARGFAINPGIAASSMPTFSDGSARENSEQDQKLVGVARVCEILEFNPSRGS